DGSAYVVVAQLSGVGDAHHDQPATVRIDAVADGAKYLAIRPVAQCAGRRQVRRYEGADRNWEMLADVLAAGQRSRLGVTTAAEAVDDRAAAGDLIGGPDNRQVR